MRTAWNTIMQKARRYTLVSNITLVKKEGRLLGAVESFNTDESLFRIAHRLLNTDTSASFQKIIGDSLVMREAKDEPALLRRAHLPY